MVVGLVQLWALAKVPPLVWDGTKRRMFGMRAAAAPSSEGD